MAIKCNQMSISRWNYSEEECSSERAGHIEGAKCIYILASSFFFVALNDKRKQSLI